MKRTVMMAFDTSTKVTGYGIYINGKLSDHGLVDKRKEKNLEIRLEDMCLGINELLNHYKPDIVVVEKQSFAVSVKNAVLNAEIIGTIRGWALCKHAEFVELQPTTWRSIVGKETGVTCPARREYAKAWALDRVNKLWPDIDITDDNEAEGILLGLARDLQMKVSIRNICPGIV